MKFLPVLHYVFPAALRLAAVVLPVFLFSLPLSAEIDSLEIRYAGETGHIPVGSDIVAMGENGVVLPRHASSSLWNPAAPAFIESADFSGEYANLYGGLSQQGCAGLSMPFSGGLAASIMYVPFLSGHIQLEDTLPGTYQERLLNQNLRADGSYINAFVNDHHLVLVSIARRFSLSMPRPVEAGLPLPLDIGIGFSFKSSWQTMNPTAAPEYGMNVNLDAGVIARAGLDYDLTRKTVCRQLLLGMAVRDFLPSPVVWIRSRDEYNPGREYRESIQPTVISGISYVDKSGDFGADWTLSAGIERQYKITYHYGIEAQFREMVAFRGGVSNRVPSIGAGIRYKKVYLDYAFCFDELAASPVRLTLGTRF